MKLTIIKPPRTEKPFVTLTPAGLLFFSKQATAELNIQLNAGVLMAQDEKGNLYMKASDDPNADAFRVYKHRNGAAQVRYIKIDGIIKHFDIKVRASTRYDLIEVDEGFYKIEGLK